MQMTAMRMSLVLIVGTWVVLVEMGGKLGGCLGLLMGSITPITKG